MNGISSLPAVLCLWLALAATSAAQVTNVVFSDDFESGTLTKWTTTAGSALDPSTPTNAVPPSPTGKWSAYMNTSTDRMHHNIIADNGGVELDGHTLFTCWIYDDASGLATRV